MSLGFAAYQSPIGIIRVIADESGVKRVELFEEDWNKFLKENPTIKEDRTLCGEAVRQLDEYFNGLRKEFDLPLSIEGTEFRKKVWNALLNIPYGEIRSYSDVAEMIGNPKAVRAVGQANRANQLPIIIPCHRVIGKGGSLVGYAGSNTPIKEMLLEAEGHKTKS
ncbi:methylated-DNA--[protein]-cysteine S-methyltransferase [Neobacillus ginsengisoli]|uniref:Methylated-DNA--protein-cysteine methyltransferase n=1 Tax=Neobacillus ginsengisoli TaxID=904295 RepID=A0ABT9Y2I2_9BACI|nr:methylated-DNA--[protein]-cysteine S-methyltransferase [Neobacillus ginsengisoli]MDQ0202028.1 methylated-DNA-[protein]-cysteine S-methyltransferase [Neobacillus ginsengisoli]